ncbi:MAG: hypothetical protein R3B13_19945 [Polyangiaceae bacterium]
MPPSSCGGLGRATIAVALIVTAAPGCGDGEEERFRPVPVVPGVGEVLTGRYDNARTGAYGAETLLTPKSASALTLSRKLTLDGELYAQPLVLESEGRALVMAATMEDSVLAFDADSGEIAWRVGEQRELGTPAFSKRNVGGNNGIMATPVIDGTTRALYVVSRDCDPQFPPEAPHCVFHLSRIHADSGALEEQVEIQGSVRFANGSTVQFEPSVQWNRPALLLAEGELFVAFGSGPNGDLHEEDFVYHGWVFRYDVGDLASAPDVMCTTPAGRGGSVWQGGAGPAANDEFVYFAGANGILSNSVHPPADFPAEPMGQEDSVFKLPIHAPFPAPGEAIPQYADTRPYRADGNVFQYMETGDVGFGSSGPTLLAEANRLLIGSKPALVYLLDAGDLSPAREPMSPFSELSLQPDHSLYLHGWWDIPPIYGSFVFFRPRASDGSLAHYGFAYAWPSKDRLASFRYDYDSDTFELERTSDLPALEGGGNLVLTSNDGDEESAVLWALTRAPKQASPAGTLWAIDPRTLAVIASWSIPAWSKFTPPTVVGGRVYVPSTSNEPGTKQQLLMFGLPR